MPPASIGNSADVEYLKQSVGDPLSKALSACASHRPDDAIAFVAEWLRTWAKQEEIKRKLEIQEKKLKEDRARYNQLYLESLKKISKEKELDDKVNHLIATIRGWECWTTKQWKEFVQHFQSIFGVSAVCLGRVDEDGEDTAEGKKVVLRYPFVAPSSSQQFMHSHRLLDGEGVTWASLVEQPEDPVPESEEEKAKLALMPKKRKYPTVYVEEVIDNASVKFFGLTNMGSYVALPAVYKSRATLESLNTARAKLLQANEELEKERASREEAIKTYQETKEKARVEAANTGLDPKAQEDAATAAVGGAEQPEAYDIDAARLVAEEATVNGLPAKTVKLVLCVDSLGQAEAIRTVNIKQMERVADALVEGLEAIEKAAVLNEAKNRISPKEREKVFKLKDELAAEMPAPDRQAKVSEFIANLNDELGGGSQLAQPLGDAKATFEHVHGNAVARQDGLLELSKSKIADPLLVQTLGAVMVLLGCPPRALYEVGTTKLDSLLVREALDAKALTLLANYDPTGTRRYSDKTTRFSTVVKMFEGIVKPTAIEEIAQPVTAVLYAWLEAAMNLRKADIQYRKDLVERIKKAIADAEAALAAPAPEGADEDQVAAHKQQAQQAYEAAEVPKLKKQLLSIVDDEDLADN